MKIEDLKPTYYLTPKVQCPIYQNEIAMLNARINQIYKIRCGMIVNDTTLLQRPKDVEVKIPKQLLILDILGFFDKK